MHKTKVFRGLYNPFIQEYKHYYHVYVFDAKGTTLVFTEKSYTFGGAVANYDPQNPITSVPTNLGTETSNIDLDKFLTDAGDAREDS